MNFKVPAISLILCLVAPVLPAAAQSASDAISPVLGTVKQGNTTIEFQAAKKSDLNLGEVKAWTDFAGEHPQIASQVSANPSLLGNDGFVGKNPELARLFENNAGLRDAMVANPGNFLVPGRALAPTQ